MRGKLPSWWPLYLQVLERLYRLDSQYLSILYLAIHVKTTHRLSGIRKCRSVANTVDNPTRHWLLPIVFDLHLSLSFVSYLRIIAVLYGLDKENRTHHGCLRRKRYFYSMLCGSLRRRRLLEATVASFPVSPIPACSCIS